MTIEVVTPEKVGLSSERLRRIDTHLQDRYLTPKKSPVPSRLLPAGAK